MLGLGAVGLGCVYVCTCIQLVIVGLTFVYRYLMGRVSFGWVGSGGTGNSLGTLITFVEVVDCSRILPPWEWAGGYYGMYLTALIIDCAIAHLCRHNGTMNKSVKLEPGTTEWNHTSYKDYTWSS